MLAGVLEESKGSSFNKSHLTSENSISLCFKTYPYFLARGSPVDLFNDVITN